MPYVYLVQPKELIGTSRYKVGMSALDNLSRMRSYKSGTRMIFICECEDALDVERKLIKVFNDNFTRIAGKEYFESPDELKMMNLFITTVMDHKNAAANPIEEEQKSDWMDRFAFK